MTNAGQKGSFRIMYKTLQYKSHTQIPLNHLNNGCEQNCSLGHFLVVEGTEGYIKITFHHFDFSKFTESGLFSIKIVYLSMWIYLKEKLLSYLFLSKKSSLEY